MSLDPKRVNQIAYDLYTSVCGANQDREVLEAAKAETTKASDALTSKRESIMQAVASMSANGGWTEPELKAAAKKAGEMHQDQDDKKTIGAIKTFVNDCQRAAHPLVRHRFDDLYKIVDTVWTQETEQKALDNATPTPVKKCFKRKYHA